MQIEGNSEVQNEKLKFFETVTTVCCPEAESSVQDARLVRLKGKPGAKYTAIKQLLLLRFCTMTQSLAVHLNCRQYFQRSGSFDSALRPESFHFYDLISR